MHEDTLPLPTSRNLPLGLLGEPLSVPLRKTRAPPTPSMRENLEDALHRLRSRCVPPDELPDMAGRVDSRCSLGHCDHDQLGSALSSTMPSIRLESARAIQKLGRASAPLASAAASALGDTDHDVRKAAAVALGRMGHVAGEHAHAVGALARDRSGVDDGSWEVREVAVRSLGNLGSPTLSSVTDLAAALHDRSPAVRKAADDALQRNGSAVVEHLGVALLRDPTPRHRLWAAQALGSLGSVAAMQGETLASALRDENREVRLASAAALDGLGALAPPHSMGLKNRWMAQGASSRSALPHKAKWDLPPSHAAGVSRSSQHVGICRHPASRCTCRRVC